MCASVRECVYLYVCSMHVCVCVCLWMILERHRQSSSSLSSLSSTSTRLEYFRYFCLPLRLSPLLSASRLPLSIPFALLFSSLLFSTASFLFPLPSLASSSPTTTTRFTHHLILLHFSSHFWGRAAHEIYLIWLLTIWTRRPSLSPLSPHSLFLDGV